MRLCRFTTQADAVPRPGLMLEETSVMDLTAAGIFSVAQILEVDEPAELTASLARRTLPRLPLAQVTLCCPLDRQEVWAAGVTYLRSKTARMEESALSASAYDRVYDALRPELFFKSLPEKVVGPGQPVGIRSDAHWSVPEPELALVFNSRGRLAGITIGNDMSSRDIEGENPLYLPQAKVYRGSCAVGPWIRVGADEAEARRWEIRLEITRAGGTVFSGETPVDRLKRSFAELGSYLYRCQEFPHGAVLLTGTGIVPPDHFTLEPGDRIAITLTGVGRLENPVVTV
ncbi:fumarylacetoacetate hydrolase family protein [Fontisphaera persica]|uniref:fumarylacetoacetate hydrolase family protein n=1 Tax=Fontisphaera persica TaxID=2974023 RepID=UPI0024C02197|nr:fumarylacetoacetate hydrolase family protein [Fontisphaera persica]WCJ58158.1 fumarylacetoacetate hydrolase family protein [Fontisphaera persica]